MDIHFPPLPEPLSRIPLRSQQGLTLVELMVTLVLMAIIVGLAAPSFNRLYVSNRIDGAENTLLRNLNYVRSEAIRRNQRVTICPKGENTMGCVETRDWRYGWLVFIDDDNDDQWDQADDEELLRIGEGVADLGTIRSSLETQAIDYAADGRLGGVGTTLLICSPDTAIRRALVLTASGRARQVSQEDIEKTANADSYGAAKCTDF